jgi:hypothetical protein
LKTARYFDAAPILPEGTFESHGMPGFPAIRKFGLFHRKKGD